MTYYLNPHGRSGVQQKSVHRFPHSSYQYSHPQEWPQSSLPPPWRLQSQQLLLLPPSGPLRSLLCSLGASAVFSGKSEWQSKTQTNGSRISCMQVWEPYNNKKFETLSYLPPLSQDSLAKQVDYLIANKWHPCIEFDRSDSVSRENSNMPGYYDGRYWTMWKLPMFGCTDPSQVLREVAECKAKYGDTCYIRVLGFDNVRQVQCSMFIVHKPGQ